jgi:hypothetical protein
MAWTAEHRRAADRRGLRYPSDLREVVGAAERSATEEGGLDYFPRWK